MSPKDPKALRGPGARAVLAAVTRRVDRCTDDERASYAATLVGITHLADRWTRDPDGTLVLVMEPRGSRVDGGAVASDHRSMGGR